MEVLLSISQLFINDTYLASDRDILELHNQPITWNMYLQVQDCIFVIWILLQDGTSLTPKLHRESNGIGSISKQKSLLLYET